MASVSEKITDSTFVYSQPWFYNNELALRCELGVGDGEEYMNNAIERVVRIASILFENRKVDAVFYNEYFDADGNVCECGYLGLDISEVITFDIDLLHSLGHVDEDISAVKRYISYNVSFMTVIEIIKKQVYSQYDPLVSVVSFENQCIFSVYDDRGCDIVFFSEEKFKEFYLKLYPYLLDFDRETMKNRYDSLCI